MLKGERCEGREGVGHQVKAKDGRGRLGESLDARERCRLVTPRLVQGCETKVIEMNGAGR